MATTTANITITSTDLLTDSLDLQSTMTLYNAATQTGVTKTTGLARYSTGVTTEVKFLDKASTIYGTDAKAAKLYIKNTSGSATETVTLTLGTIASTKNIGILHGGEWALIPWHGDDDINVTQSVAGLVIEWMLFYE